MRIKNQWTVVGVALIVMLALAGLFLPNRAEAPLQIGAQAVRERIAIKAREDSYIYNGADVIWYSDELSTENHRIDGAGGAQFGAPTAQTTATPGVLIDCAHVGTCVEVRDAGTPVWTINDGGGVTHTGDETYSGGTTFNNWVKAAAPTAIATATPGVVIDSLGVSNILEIRDAATPVVVIANGGAATFNSGATALTSLTTGSDGSGVDVTFYSATAGDTFLWDASEEALTITGTNAQDALNVDDGNVDIADDLDVDGTTNLDEVDIDGVLNLVVGTEHIGVPSIVSTAITYTAAAGGTGAVATIADGEIWFVWAVFVNVTTDFDCTGDDATLIVGDGLDTDGFVTLADAELQVADTEQTGSPAGWQGLVAATMGVYLDGAVSSAPHIYAPSGSAETIDWLVDEASGETITAGAATIYVVYTRLQ